MKTDQEIQVACKEAMSLLPKGAIVNRTWLTQMTIIKVSNDTNIALRDIQKGDELTVYYGQRPPVNCNCQSASCPNKR